MPAAKKAPTQAEQLWLSADLTVSETEKNRAEAAKTKAETVGVKAEADRVRYQAEIALYDLQARRRKEEAELAKDTNNHVYFFGEEVTDKTVRACISQLTEWARLEPGCDIEIVFNSPGGSIFEGMHLWDFISYLKSRGHTITTVGLGMAASMAAILLQAGNVRVLGRESYLMLHEGAMRTGGKISDIEDDLILLNKMQKRIVKILTERSNLSESRIKGMMRRKDCWLDSDECLKYGLVDELR